MKETVFVNRTLNMKKISYIGLDMDHTLVRYKSKNFEALAHRIMCEKLVAEKGYPQSILNFKLDWNRAIRGLIIDRARGNILKLSRHTAIRQSFHGTQPIPYDQQKKIYKSTYIDLKDKAYDKIDTTFSISFASLYAHLVDLKDSDDGFRLPDYAGLAEDLNQTLDMAHRDGSLKDRVRDNLSQYIIKDAALVRGLERYKVHGKKFFVVTNSDFKYTKLLLDYAINPYLKNHSSWQDLFEFVIVSARKPDFFFGDAAFEKLDPQTGEAKGSVQRLQTGVFSGGCANRLTRDLHLDSDEILYIGDHIYGDIVRLKKDCAWRTALVVEELEQEIQNIKKAQPLSNEIEKLMAKKLPLEIKIDELIVKSIEKENKLRSTSLRKDSKTHKIKGQIKSDKIISDLIKKSSEIDKKISPLIKKLQKIFNPYWGEVMRVGIEESYFAYQVDRFACIYMSQLRHLLEHSPRLYYRSQKRLLPHERALLVRRYF